MKFSDTAGPYILSEALLQTNFVFDRSLQSYNIINYLNSDIEKYLYSLDVQDAAANVSCICIMLSVVFHTLNIWPNSLI